MLIEFSQPVAELNMEIYGARRVTDNRGNVIRFNPPIGPNGRPTGTVPMARFTGGGITSITISDPIEHDLYSSSGSVLAQGFWEMGHYNFSWTPDFIYQQCNCDRATFQAPPTQNVSSGWPLDLNGTDPNWSMLVQMTADDGLVLRDIKLGQRYMAEKISVPYYYLETSAFPKQRGELKPDSADSSMRSRLVSYHATTDEEKLVVEATYVIDEIPAGSESCLEIIQRYEFYKSRFGDHCEPSGTLPCSRWKPIVKYRFVGSNGESLTSINIAQRQHRMVDDNLFNTIGLFRDTDGIPDALSHASGFARKYNPLMVEWYDPILINGNDAQQWDNVHQTFSGVVQEPGLRFHSLLPPYVYFKKSGCPECIHSHWRWGLITSLLGHPEGQGGLIGIPEGSTQDLDFAILKHQEGEDDPDDFKNLFEYWQSIRTYNTVARNSLQVYRGSAPEDVVYWQSGTGHQYTDTFFSYGAFFQPILTTSDLYGTGAPLMSGRANLVSMASSETCEEDGVASVTADRIYAAGTGGSTLPAEGEIISSTVFAEANETDPDLANNVATENTTIFPDGNAAPTINITNPEQGALFVGPATLNLSATASDNDGSINRVEFYGDGNLLGSATAGAPNQYSFAWNNVPFGPHALLAVAVDNLGKTAVSNPVMLIVNGSASVGVASPANWATFNKPADITVVANAMLAGGSITKVDFYANGFIFLGTGALTGANQYSLVWNSAPAGKHVLTAVATDNTGVRTTSAPVNIAVNERPVIGLVGPASGTVFSAPANITLTANSSDWGGSITKVDFYANGSLVGTKTAYGVNLFNFSWANVSAGSYSLTAVATDSLGATTTSAPINLRVNAAPTVSFVTPSNGTQFTAPANITLTSSAADSDGTIGQVDFYANGYRIGTGAAIGGGQYSFTWSGVGIGSYSFTAVATDNDGATTLSGGPSVTVTSPILFVTGSTTLNSTDTSVKTLLEALNHTVTVKSAASAVTADADGKALVVISSTVTPTSVGTKFRTVAVPVLTWESGIYNNMGMTGSASQDSGTKNNQTQVSVTNSAHPLAAGFSGNTTVASSGTFNWGKPNANAISVAIIVGDTAKTVIFGYEVGAVMPRLTAPARRVGFFMHDTTTFNANGTALLDAAIRWAIGGGSISGSVATSPVGPVNLTNEGLIDWGHWGMSGPTSFDHKAGVAQPISNFTKIGSGGLSWFMDCPTTFTWADGTPTLSATNTATGINTSGTVGNGLEITMPADANLKNLKLYVGVWYTQGRLEASLSDGSAPSFIDATLSNSGGVTFGVYTIDYKAGSPGQKLKLRFTILSQYFPPYGNVALEAAALR